MARGSQLSRDADALIGRRAALGVIGSGVAGLWLAGCRGGPTSQSYNDVTARAADGATCTAYPGETEGPYPADGRGRQNVANVLADQALARRDIRASFGGLQGVADGVPLELELRLVDVDNGCAPLAGRALYLWHCDAAGRYSLYELPERNYLRGLQVSGADGIVRFTTIVPGCYDGRFPHMHLEIFDDPARAASGSDARLTSQLAVPGDASAAVYADPRYAGSAANLGQVSLQTDGIFADNTPAQIAAQTLAMSGDPARSYLGTATIGLTTRYGDKAGA